MYWTPFTPYISYISHTIITSRLTGLVNELLDVLDTGRISDVVAALQNSLRNLAAPQIYTLKLFFLKQIFRQRGELVLKIYPAKLGDQSNII